MQLRTAFLTADDSGDGELSLKEVSVIAYFEIIYRRLTYYDLSLLSNSLSPHLVKSCVKA